MRIRSITPIRVPPGELDRRRDRYARLAPPGVHVHLDNLVDTPDTPMKLDTAQDVAASNDLVLAMARHTDPQAFDVILPDCVLDPAVARDSDLPVPIVGILQLTTTHLSMFDQPFTAVTRNRAIADELAARVEAYGLAHSFLGVDVLELDLAAIQDEDRWQAAMAPACSAASSRGASMVINGCSAVDVPTRRLGVVTVDPTALALRLMGTMTDIIGPPTDANDRLPHEPVAVEQGKRP